MKPGIFIAMALTLLGIVLTLTHSFNTLACSFNAIANSFKDLYLRLMLMHVHLTRAHLFNALQVYLTCLHTDTIGKSWQEENMCLV